MGEDADVIVGGEVDVVVDNTLQTDGRELHRILLIPFSRSDSRPSKSVISWFVWNASVSLFPRTSYTEGLLSLFNIEEYWYISIFELEDAVAALELSITTPNIPESKKCQIAQ